MHNISILFLKMNNKDVTINPEILLNLRTGYVFYLNIKRVSRKLLKTLFVDWQLIN